jgi:hypothetical protein
MSGELVPYMGETEYHANAALSASGAKRLIQTCPAIFRHEQLNGRPNKAAFDFGHAAHGLVLGKGEPLHVIEADDWRGKEARELRDAAYAVGAVPILAKDYEQVYAMHLAIKAHPLAAALLDPERGTAEESAFWTDEHWGVNRRARFDWRTTLGHGRPCITDYKTSTTSNPAAIGRKVADFGYHQQHAWYVDAAEAIGFEDPAFLFIFQEKVAPYVVTVIELDDAAIARGRELNARALEIFRDCTAADIWPGYVEDHNLARVSLPRWAFYDNETEVA